MPDHIRDRAREMAKQELQRRLEELNMSVSEATDYSKIVGPIDSQVALLHDLFESSAISEYERSDFDLSQTWLRKRKNVYG